MLSIQKSVNPDSTFRSTGSFSDLASKATWFLFPDGVRCVTKSSTKTSHRTEKAHQQEHLQWHLEITANCKGETFYDLCSISPLEQRAGNMRWVMSQCLFQSPGWLGLDDRWWCPQGGKQSVSWGMEQAWLCMLGSTGSCTMAEEIMERKLRGNQPENPFLFCHLSEARGLRRWTCRGHNAVRNSRCCSKQRDSVCPQVPCGQASSPWELLEVFWVRVLPEASQTQFLCTEVTVAGHNMKVMVESKTKPKFLLLSSQQWDRCSPRSQGGDTLWTLIHKAAERDWGGVLARPWDTKADY